VHGDKVRSTVDKKQNDGKSKPGTGRPFESTLSLTRHSEIMVNTGWGLQAMARSFAERFPAPAFDIMPLGDPVLALHGYGIRPTPRLRTRR
jgi:hypothetical protein